MEKEAMMVTPRNRSRTATLVTLFFLLMLVALPAGAQTGWGDAIDSFSTGQSRLEVDGTEKINYSTVDTAGSDIFGAERDIYIEWLDGDTIEDVMSARVAATTGTFAHSQESGVTGYTLISWDGNDGDATALNTNGLAGADLTNNGNTDRFYVLVIRADLGAPLVIRVYEYQSSDWCQATLTIPSSTGTPTMFELEFDDFSMQSGVSMNWASVGAVTMEIDGRNTADLDVTLDWFGPGGPTAVDVASLTAAPAEGNVLIAWETGSETNLQGFNLHRGEMADGAYTQINASVIQALNHGQPVGASYYWLDEDIVRGETYYYKLEGLEDGGLTTFFGPVSARAVHTVYLPLLVRE